MSAATSKGAARGGRALILVAALLGAAAALVGGASATSLVTASTTTAATVSPASASVGDHVRLGATVTASDGTAPTGTVQWIAQFTAAGSSTPSLISLGTATLGAGTGSSTASLDTTTLQAGTYQVTAQYNPQGSLSWNGSSSSAVPLAVGTVAPPTTDLGFTESAQTIDADQTVTFTTTLTTAPGHPAPTGIVRYSAGPDASHLVTIGQGTISGGTATLTKGGWSGGSYVVFANYDGDDVYGTASAGPLSLTVNAQSVAVTTHTTVVLTPSTITEGQSVTITAYVVKDGMPNPPPGGPIVEFVGGAFGSDQSTWVKLGVPGQTTLDANGQANETVGGWNPGKYTIVAQYTGDVVDGYVSSSGDATLTVLSVGGSGGGTSTLAYTGATSGVSHDHATLSGKLTDSTTGDPVSGEDVTFAVGSDTCTATTDSFGNASCGITISGDPGWATVTAAASDGSSASKPFTIEGRPTVTVAHDVTAGAGATATLSATLTDEETSAPLSGLTVSLTVGTDTCTGTTDGSGDASCTVTASEGVGGHTITAAFGGGGGYAGSSGSATLTIQPTPTTTTYTGDAHDLVGSTATLSATVAPTPDGGTVTFTLGTQSCSAPLSGASASCTVALNQAPGSGYTVTAAYGGDTSFGSSSASAPFTIVAPATTTHLSPVAPVAAGTSVTLTANLSTALGPLAGETLTLSLGTKSCTATTDAAGNASCSVTAGPALGTTAVSAAFAGDPVYSASSDHGSTLVYALPGGGSFVVGDKTATGSVMFWGSQWAKVNALSGGPTPDAFKGWASSPSVPACGATWTTGPGNSPPPPAGPLPAYMAVIVTSSSSKSGPAISGNVVGIVIVKTNAGYKNDPGHAGTGTVVATVCGSTTPPPPPPGIDCKAKGVKCESLLADPSASGRSFSIVYMDDSPICTSQAPTAVLSTGQSLPVTVTPTSGKAANYVDANGGSKSSKNQSLLSFTVPSSVPSGTYTVTVTVYDGDGDLDQYVWSISV